MVSPKHFAINTGMCLKILAKFHKKISEGRVFTSRARKLKKGEKREETEPVTVTLNFFKNVHSKDKNQILQ